MHFYLFGSQVVINYANSARKTIDIPSHYYQFCRQIPLGTLNSVATSIIKVEAVKEELLE